MKKHITYIENTYHTFVWHFVLKMEYSFFSDQACYDLVRVYATVNPLSTSSTSVITNIKDSTGNSSNNTSEDT